MKFLTLLDIQLFQAYPKWNAVSTRLIKHLINATGTTLPTGFKRCYIVAPIELKLSSLLCNNIEGTLIIHLNEFLLELGNGFAFVARQRRLDTDGRNFYVDLVLYNYKLKCFVLIDLKRGDLMHQDIGQMQMYVNYYTRELMEPGDNPPIGIVLCADKSDTSVRYTLPLDNKQIYASKYMLYLPREDDSRKEMNKQIELLNKVKESNE